MGQKTVAASQIVVIKNGCQFLKMGVTYDYKCRHELLNKENSISHNNAEIAETIDPSN